MRIRDDEYAKKLHAEPWQLELLELNPSYVHWGPHEDYMAHGGSGWDSRVICPSWAEFGPWELNDLNECVHFYFSVDREAAECPLCGGDGYHPDAKPIVNSFYSHTNSGGEQWRDSITQDELEALVEAGRVKPGESLEAVNARNRPGARGLDRHDDINRLILTRARLERLGIPVECPECGGEGRVFTAPAAHVTLTLWMLHPRKGCSRGVEVSLIEKHDLPAVFAWLREAAERNAQRFAQVVGMTPRQ